MSHRDAQRRQQAGFTLTELVMVLILIGVLAAGAALRAGFGDVTVSAQARQVARDLRHAQLLAMSEGRTLRFESLGTSYRVTDTVSPVIDPATGADFVVNLEDGARLSAGTLDFDSLGRPVSGGSLVAGVSSFTLSGASQSARIDIQPVTGFASVTP